MRSAPASWARSSGSTSPCAITTAFNGRKQKCGASERRSEVSRVPTPYADITQIRFWGLRFTALSAPVGAPPSYSVVPASLRRADLGALEVCPQLPLRDVRAVLGPLLLLRREEALVDLLAEGAAHDEIPLEPFEGLVERSGKHRDGLLVSRGSRRGLSRGLLDRIWEREVVLDPVDAGPQHGCEREVGIARRIGRSQLDLHPTVRARLRHPDVRATVRPRPADVAGGLCAAHQPLVRVDEGRDDRTQAPCMRQLAGDEPPSVGGQSVRVVARQEG